MPAAPRGPRGRGQSWRSFMSVLDKVLDRIDQDLDRSLDRLFGLLRIPSISTDAAYRDKCRQAAEHLAKDLATIGFDAELRKTAGHPVVVGKGGDSSGPRALFYGHYDVQPVDPLDLWETSPFEPRIKNLGDGRKAIVARGACDDKGQLMTFVEACRAFKAVTGKLPLPITLMIEGEEECGSQHLFGFVRDNAAEFRRDVALVCDTGMWNAETPAVTTSLRGLVYEEVRLRCADRDLHSGLFGGAAQNPIRVLAKVLAAIHDANGRVTIPGFYDGVRELPPDIRADLAALDLTPEEFLGQVGLKVPAGEKDRMLIEQVSTRPTCDVNGIIGGYTGEGAKTVIPAAATAKVSFRLVPNQKLKTVERQLAAAVRRLAPRHVTASVRFLHGADPAQIKLDHPSFKLLDQAFRKVTGRGTVPARAGGSIPVVPALASAGAPVILTGIGLPDDRLHAPNEKLELKQLWDGIEVFRTFYELLGSLESGVRSR